MNLLSRLYEWIDVRIGARQVVEKEFTAYLLPRNINAWYSVGSVLLVILGLQAVTGVLLLIYYVPDAEKAFSSVSIIMNQVPFGWLIRSCHAVGSHMMMLALLLHMLSVLFMGGYKSPRELNWMSGFILFTMMQGICLTGYLLPWSQLSFWATTVATDSVSAIPVVGPFLMEFLRGGEVGRIPHSRAVLCSARGCAPGRSSGARRRACLLPETHRRLHPPIRAEGYLQPLERRMLQP